MILTIKVDAPPWMADGVKEDISMRLEGCGDVQILRVEADEPTQQSIWKKTGMICVEGFKAFRGTMRITPKCAGVAPFELTDDWLYKPDADCWYGCDRSFGADICVPMEDA